MDKTESRRRWLELRDLWNEFDPIGVYYSDDSEWPLDEYESYCGPCMRLLEQGAQEVEIEKEIHSALDHMGLKGNDTEVKEFMRRMQDWFQRNWMSN